MIMKILKTYNPIKIIDNEWMHVHVIIVHTNTSFFENKVKLIQKIILNCNPLFNN